MAMTPSQEGESRTMVLRFAGSLSGAEKEALQSALMLLEGLTRIDYDAAQWMLEYDFPSICRADIWTVICEQVAITHFSFLDRITYMLTAFAEQNEQDHRLYPRHWHTYAEDIQVHYFDRRHAGNSDTHKHLWRRYQRKG